MSQTLLGMELDVLMHYLCLSSMPSKQRITPVVSQSRSLRDFTKCHTAQLRVCASNRRLPPMPRPRGDQCVTWKLRLSLPVAAALEQLTMDPTTGAPRYGARRQLMEHLATRYLREIGFYDSQTPLSARRPLTDEDLERIANNIVEPIYV